MKNLAIDDCMEKLEVTCFLTTLHTTYRFNVVFYI